MTAPDPRAQTIRDAIDLLENIPFARTAMDAAVSLEADLVRLRDENAGLRSNIQGARGVLAKYITHEGEPLVVTAVEAERRLANAETALREAADLLPVGYQARRILDAALAGAGAPDEGETCQECRQPVRVVWTAPEALWRTATGRTDGSGILCIPCFDAASNAFGSLLRWVPEPIDKAGAPHEDSTAEDCPACGGYGWYEAHEDECYDTGDCSCPGVPVECECGAPRSADVSGGDDG